MNKRLQKAIAVIRRDVKRPSTRSYKFDYTDGSHCPRFISRKTEVEYCPLGLHPDVQAAQKNFDDSLSTPTDYDLERAKCKVDGLTKAEVRAFYTWWDDQTDIHAAVEAVWGPK